MKGLIPDRCAPFAPHLHKLGAHLPRRPATAVDLQEHTRGAVSIVRISQDSDAVSGASPDALDSCKPIASCTQLL